MHLIETDPNFANIDTTDAEVRVYVDNLIDKNVASALQFRDYGVAEFQSILNAKLLEEVLKDIRLQQARQAATTQIPTGVVTTAGDASAAQGDVNNDPAAKAIYDAYVEALAELENTRALAIRAGVTIDPTTHVATAPTGATAAQTKAAADYNKAYTDFGTALTAAQGNALVEKLLNEQLKLAT